MSLSLSESALTFFLSGISYAEECDCPKKKLSEWLEDMECPMYEQINQDLKPFGRVMFSKLYPVFMQRFNQPESMSICNYVVRDNKVCVLT